MLGYPAHFGQVNKLNQNEFILLFYSWSVLFIVGVFKIDCFVSLHRQKNWIFRSYAFVR